MASLTLTALENFPLVKAGDNLAELIVEALSANAQSLKAGDIIVIAQKIVSKAENRFRDLGDIVPGKAAVDLANETAKDPRLVQAILDESIAVVRKRPGVLIVRHRLGLIMAQAGIDQSNVAGNNERILLLPEDPDRSAEMLHLSLEEKLGVSLGIVIADSFGRPFRNGTVGVAIGAAGLASFVDRRGDRDLFGRQLQVSTIAHADELASAASILMGQADEGQPVVVVRGLPQSASLPAGTLIRPIEDDLFA